MQNLEIDDKTQGISCVNTNSFHPNQFKRFAPRWIDKSALRQIVIPLLFPSTAPLTCHEEHLHFFWSTGLFNLKRNMHYIYISAGPNW